jgi:N-acetylglucosamine-6-sulfatase
MASGRGLAPCVAAVVALLWAASAAGQPNVVLIVTDDQRWDTLSALPTVQAELVGPGTTFTNAFVVNPLCCPSRASILTGRYSRSTRVYGNGGLVNFDERTTIAVALRRAGWRTGFLGKYLNGYGGTRVPPGWERWFAFTPSNAHRYFDYRVNVDGTIIEFGPDDEAYSTDVLAGEAESFILADDSRPFFLAVFPYAPHWPAIPAPRHEGSFPALPPWRPPSYLEDRGDKPAWIREIEFDPALADELRKRQYQSLLAVDDAVGRIVSALETAGKLEETMIVLTSDNGHLWGEHGILQKVVPYEESIRVPLVVRYGGATGTDSRFALNIDLAPTVADLAGIRFQADGASLLPFLTSAQSPGRREFPIESRGYPGFPVPPYCALRTKRFLHAVYRDGSRELYDLDADPYQLDNLAGRAEWQARVRTLRARLSRLCNPPPPGFPRTLLCTREGGPGADRLLGTGGYDVICARGGADVVDARSGPDWVYAGSGDDTIRVRDGARDRVTCGGGRDVVVADARDVVLAGCEVVRRPRPS